MANEEHVRMLKESKDVWLNWRQKVPDAIPDLNHADLHMLDLRQVDLGAASLIGADLRTTRLIEAYLRQANLSGADLRSAYLNGANLRRANLIKADLNSAELGDADLTNSTIGYTTFANVDLSNVKGLETLRHHGPSSVGIDTIYRSRGKISELFLREAGVPEQLIKFMHSLVGTAFEFYSCFISYSSKDHDFAECLHADLQSKGVRCWFAPEDLKIGDKLRPSFDEAIRLHDKLMVLLSESSVKSSWVEKEVETAFERERRENRTVLFPIRLDDAVMETQEAWAADIRRMRHIGDFRDWKDHDSYKRAFERLLRDLKEGNKSTSAAQK